MLTGSDQKVRGTDRTLRCRSAQSATPPANRQALSHLVKLAEHGKPDYSRGNAESFPQGKPKGKQAEDVGKSKSCSVMEWTGAYALTQKSADFRRVLNHEKDLERTHQESTDRRRVKPVDGILSDSNQWNSIDWKKIINIVTRLQARIVKAVNAGDIAAKNSCRQIIGGKTSNIESRKNSRSRRD